MRIMPEEPYAYDGAGEAPSEAGLVALCKRIGASKGKDALIKALKQLSSALEALPQDADALGRAKGEVPRALAGLAGQGLDKDVRIYLAVCTVHMLRIWAPATPYEDEPERLEVRRRACCARPRRAARSNARGDSSTARGRAAAAHAGARECASQQGGCRGIQGRGRSDWAAAPRAHCPPPLSLRPRFSRCCGLSAASRTTPRPPLSWLCRFCRSSARCAARSGPGLGPSLLARSRGRQASMAV
jgi:hypothetical protein